MADVVPYFSLKYLTSTIYRIWCFLSLYAIGIFYVLVELNRKCQFFNKVRIIDPDKDLDVDLKNCVCVITGGSRGIGWCSAKCLLRKGCHVIITSSLPPGSSINDLHCKLSEKVKNVHGTLEIWHLELNSMDSVVSFINRFKSSGLELNILINNAAIMYAPQMITADGFESHLSVNYLGHCLLTWCLLPILSETGRKSGRMSRIVNVSSSTHYARNLRLDDLQSLKLFSSYHAYSQSKLAQIMFTFKLHRYLNQKGTHGYNWVMVNCLHPGVAMTALYENVWWVQLFPRFASFLFRTAEEGAETVLYTAISPELEGVGGKYLEDCAIVKASKYSYKIKEQDELWSRTWGLLAKWVEKCNCELPCDLL